MGDAIAAGEDCLVSELDEAVSQHLEAIAAFSPASSHDAKRMLKYLVHLAQTHRGLDDPDPVLFAKMIELIDFLPDQQLQD